MRSIWQQLLLIGPAMLVIDMVGSLPAIANVALSVVAHSTVNALVHLPLHSEQSSNQPGVPQRVAEAFTPKISAVASSAVASLEDDAPMAQVTSVSQLNDVKSTDWAFQALQSLVERYGCIVGYPAKSIAVIVR